MQDEYKEGPIRVNQLRIAAVIRRHEEAKNLALPDALREAAGEFSNRCSFHAWSMHCVLQPK